jgi:transcriptional regulator with AAA-type ATPase domain
MVGDVTGRSDEQTTLPATPTSARRGTTDDLAIRWLFPERRLSLLPRQRQARVVLGRSGECDITLPGQEVSRQHAELRREGHVYIARDLGSRNGLFVGGVRTTQAMFARGDVLRVGEWVGLVEEAPPPGAAPDDDFGLVAPGLYGGRALREALASLERAARSDLPLIVEGETGTGKEWTARAVHAWSGRQGTFLAVNCAALPEGLAEAELFGYRKGAFTGADRSSPGYFRAAHEGTLLLDEVVDLPLSLQAKLLRVLEQREVHPLGEPVPVAIDVRIVAAAQQPLHEAVRQRRFRADLCARLDGHTVRLPPLRERMSDVPELLGVKLREQGADPARIEPKLVEQLCLYDWPFNVREIDLLARHLVVMHGQEMDLRATFLPERMRPGRTAGGRTLAGAGEDAGGGPEDTEDRDERDLRLLIVALRRHAGNLTKAAAEVSISRQRAYRLMGARSLADVREGHLPVKEPASRA